MANGDEKQTISVQLTSEFFDQFMRFCFRNELSKSDAIRQGLLLLMEAENFIRNSKTNGEGKQ